MYRTGVAANDAVGAIRGAMKWGGAMTTIEPTVPNPNPPERSSGLRELFARLFRLSRRVDGGVPKNRQSEQSTTSEQFFRTLESNFEALKNKKDTSNGARNLDDLKEKIQELLKGADRSWRTAYQVERLLVELYSGANLWVELNRRMNEATTLKIPSVQFYTTTAPTANISQLDNGANDDARRALLHRLVNDLQWFYTQRYIKRRYAVGAVRRVTTVFILSFLTFVVTLVVLMEPNVHSHFAQKNDQYTTEDRSPNENSTGGEVK